MIIKVTQEEKDILEAYHYQVNSRKDIIAAVLNTTLNLNEERFIKYHREYEEFYKDYEIAKEKIITPYIKQYFKDNRKHSWSLNFETCELTIEE